MEADLERPSTNNRPNPEADSLNEYRTSAPRPTYTQPAANSFSGVGLSDRHFSPASILTRSESQPAQFERGEVPPEGRTDRFGNSRADIEEARREIAEQGKPGFGFMTDLMRDHRIVAIGESHVPNDPQRKHAREILEALAKGGANMFAAEIQDTPENRAAIERFNRTGNIDDLRDLHLAKEYEEVLRIAHELGMKVVPVDMPHTPDDKGSSDRARDRYMHDRIMAMLADPKNKVVFWVGAGHLNTYGHIPGRQPSTAAELLKRDIDMPTIAFVDRKSTYSPLSPMAESVNGPTSIRVQDTRTLRNLRDYIGVPASQVDYYILYPSQR